MKELDIDTWARKEHFHFFKQFEEPYFGVTVNLDCTIAYATCKDQGISFFLYYLHKSLQAANEVEPFRYRIKEGKVYVYDQINGSATIHRPDGTFGFSYMTYHEDFSIFARVASEAIARTQQSNKLVPSISGDNVIHFSALPWIDFTAVSHARSYSSQDSCPKITVGKMKEDAGRKSMALSIHVNHALMDGYHVGQYVELFQELMDGGE